jgi:DNA-binding beta-propeller fold protein YncE
MKLLTIRRCEFERPANQQGNPLARARYAILICLLVFAAAAVQAQGPAKAVPPKPAAEISPAKTTEQPATQKIVDQGIAIEFSVDPLKEASLKPRAGEDSVVKIRVSDTTTGTPVKGLNLSVWMSLRAGDKAPDMKQCRERIQSFIGGTLRERPDVDLNSYYILALNKSPDISVIDPLLGFGGSKLLALVMLKSPGEDWALSRDRERLFVTMPLINQVAVVDTRSWKVATNIDTGVKPASITLQPDQKYLWVVTDGNQGEGGGVTVIDAVTFKVAAQISTGAGHHEVVISSDNRFAFISNGESGTISIVDVRKLQKINDVKVSANSVSMALSELSKAIYVASETDGTVAVIDEQSQQLLTRMKAKAGLGSIRFSPGGRYGFAINTKENLVNIFDAASNRMLHEVKVGKAPVQVIFSDTFAFVRSLGTETVSMIRLATLGTDVEITDFPGGQKAPDTASPPVRADSIVRAPEGNAVIVANPADKVIYYYAEGMAAPMGDFDNYRREPRAVLVVDRSLRETNPGVYSAMVKFPASGIYDVAFLADAPRIAHCFEAVSAPNPLLKQERQIALRLEPQIKEMKLPVGRDFPLRFKLIETATDKPRDGLKDVRVLTYSGAWQRRDIAKSIGGGVYETNLNVPEPGAYTVFVESFSMGVRFQDLPQMMLQATEEKAGPVSGESNSARKP